MKRKNIARNALFTSIISLMLCVSMLVGTTFAWFTDSVVSGNNIIAAGNLDVELDYWNGTKWETVNGATNLFNGNLWEPGHTEVVYLRLSNLGTLALKYKLGINIASETEGTNVAGATFKLSDYIYMGVVEGVNGETNPYANRAAAAAAAAANAGIISTGYAKSGSMAADAEDLYMAVVVYMPETVDNVANYKTGTVRPEINLGINLFATQVEAEMDSFGNDYDANAELCKFIVSSEEELVEALAAAKNGDVIGIKGNKVTWSTGAGIGSTPFIADGVKNITLIGVEAGATFTAIGSGVGAIGIDAGTVTFKDLKIVDKSDSYAENSWEYGYLEFRGNTVFENCNIVNAIMMEGDSATFTNCFFNSNKESEYAVWVSNGNASFESCTFTGARGLKVHEAYGSEVGTVSVNGNTFIELSKKPGLAIGDVNPNTTVKLTNNKFVGTQAYESDTDVATFNFINENNMVASQDSNLPTGLYKITEDTWQATNATALGAGLDKAKEGDTIVLAQDVVYTGSGYANITKNITLDLGGNTLSTTSLGVVAKAGTIKNGVISNPVGERAALRTWSGVSIENVVIDAPENGGITVASGNELPYIKNVTINAKTYGIELQYGASVDTIENVNIVAGENGIVVQAGTIGNIANTIIKAGNAGIYGQLKGVCDLKITVDASNKIGGGSYGIYLCDEGANIVPDGTAYLTYYDANTFDGGIKDIELAFAQENKLVVKTFVTTADGLTLLKNTISGEQTLYNTAGFTGSSMNVPERVTALRNSVFGYTDIKTVEIPKSVTDFGASGVSATNASGGAFKNSNVETVILSEGMTEIPDAAFNGATKLTSVNIPSTVKRIGVNAFRSTALTELVIPATVEEIAYGAFRDMTSLTTVTINGDAVTLPGYVFRGCSNLRNVYLNVNSLTLKGSMNFSNASSNNPGTNNITFYVLNEEVAELIKTHMGVGSTVKIYVGNEQYAEIK